MEPAMTAEPSFSSSSISAETAQLLIDACTAKGVELERLLSVAICDNHGNLKAFQRMDGAPLLTIQMATDKAHTAAAFGLSTDAWFDFVKDDPPLAMGVAPIPGLMVIGGGYPLIHDGQLVGGIGVSGGHYSEDMACARAALEATGFTVG
jgi:uncharacterized protein GlcG (DUF336 family)